MTTHTIKKARGQDHCAVCLRAIRRHRGVWRHLGRLYWDPATASYVMR